jgi:hypothetical protein
MFGGLFFEFFLDTLYFDGCNFLISNLVLTIVISVLDVSRGGVQVLFGHRKHWTLSLDPACPEQLSVRSLTSLP